MPAPPEQPSQDTDAYATRIRACRICVETPWTAPLGHAPRPILRVSATARLLIASQAPGLRVHLSGVPFTDASGDRLRGWLGLTGDVFYDVSRVAIAPMGFCFPGYSAAKADLPPRRECAPTWHDGLFARMPQIELVLAIGAYAQAYHYRRLGIALPKGLSLSDTVRRWRDFEGHSPRVIALPHPSWRNSGWLKRNPWFETDVLPVVRAEVARLTG